MSKINMGVIGLGGISEVHINGIKKSPDAKLVAVCDINEHTLHKRADELGVAMDSRYVHSIDMLRHAKLDAVSICTPNGEHLPITKQAIENNIHFLLEKPITLNYKEAQELIKQANTSKVKSMVAFSYRYKTAARQARHLLQKNKLGRIRHVYGQYFQSWALSEETPLYWRFKKDIAGSGALGDLGSHLLDLLSFLTDEKCTKLCAGIGTYVNERLDENNQMGNVDVDDYCHIIGEMTNNVSFSQLITRDATTRGNYQRIEIYGTKGGLVYKLDENGREDELEVSLNGEHYHKIDVDDGMKSDQMQSFFDIILGKADGLSASLEDGLRNQYLLDKVLESARLRTWVDTIGC